MGDPPRGGEERAEGEEGGPPKAPAKPKMPAAGVPPKAPLEPKLPAGGGPPPGTAVFIHTESVLFGAGERVIFDHRQANAAVGGPAVFGPLGGFPAPGAPFDHRPLGGGYGEPPGEAAAPPPGEERELPPAELVPFGSCLRKSLGLPCGCLPARFQQRCQACFLPVRLGMCVTKLEGVGWAHSLCPPDGREGPILVPSGGGVPLGPTVSGPKAPGIGSTGLVIRAPPRLPSTPAQCKRCLRYHVVGGPSFELCEVCNKRFCPECIVIHNSSNPPGRVSCAPEPVPGEGFPAAGPPPGGLPEYAPGLNDRGPDGLRRSDREGDTAPPWWPGPWVRAPSQPKPAAGPPPARGPTPGIGSDTAGNTTPSASSGIFGGAVVNGAPVVPGFGAPPSKAVPPKSSTEAATLLGSAVPLVAAPLGPPPLPPVQAWILFSRVAGCSVEPGIFLRRSTAQGVAAAIGVPWPLEEDHYWLLAPCRDVGEAVAIYRAHAERHQLERSSVCVDWA